MTKKIKNIVVLAGNYREYNEYINFIQKNSPRYFKEGLYNFMYVVSEKDVVGITVDEVIKVGTYYKVGGVYELELLAKNRIRNRIIKN